MFGNLKVSDTAMHPRGRGDHERSGQRGEGAPARKLFGDAVTAQARVRAANVGRVASRRSGRLAEVAPACRTVRTRVSRDQQRSGCQRG